MRYPPFLMPAFCLLLMGVLGSLCAADEQLRPADALAPGTYTYLLKKTVEQTTVGETITHTTEIGWRFRLARAGDDTSPRWTLTIQLIKGVLTSPGLGEQRFSTGDTPTTSNPGILAPLRALNGVTITLYCDGETGRVTRATGSEEVVTRINQLFPGDLPGEPGPFDAFAREVYSNEALARWWHDILLLPPSTIDEAGEALNLLPVLRGGDFVRIWDPQSRATYRLESGENSEPVLTLHVGETPIEARIGDFSGEGVVLGDADGQLLRHYGRVSFTATIEVASQAVEQRERWEWYFQPLESEQP